MRELAIPARIQLPDLAPGTQECPGRNHPLIGRWLVEEFCAGIAEPVVADPMCGSGQLWSMRPKGVRVFGCEMKPERVQIARTNGIDAVHGWAESWTPPVSPHLIGFSPIFPNCDHDSGKGERQQAMVRERGAQAMQAIEGSRDLLRVFLQLASYAGSAPVAVIVRNWIEGQIEVDWTSEVEASMRFAGFPHVERFWRAIPPGMTESWKVARGECQARTGKPYRVVDREWILVGRRGA